MNPIHHEIHKKTFFNSSKIKNNKNKGEKNFYKNSFKNSYSNKNKRNSSNKELKNNKI